MSKPSCQNCGGAQWTTGGRCVECNEFPTLGWLVGDWIEDNCVIPDGDHIGEPFLLTDEMWRIILRHYRIDPHVTRDRAKKVWRLPFVYFRGTLVTRPPKWGKGPLSSSVICAEASPEGPVLFDGWDAHGQPVGRAWSSPWIQVAAVSEAQTANIWRALMPMIERGALATYITDVNLTKINLPGGGLIEPVTSAAGSRQGQRVTTVTPDELASWFKRNGGHDLIQTLRRNLAGTGGRIFGSTNGWDPSRDSVAQRLAEAKAPGFYHDDVEAPPASLTNKREVIAALKVVYGDSWWVSPERIHGDIVALVEEGEAAQAERFYLNRKKASESAAFDLEKWQACADEDHGEPEDRTLIVIGVDGARYRDALAIVATDVKAGYQWPLTIIERPDNAPDDYEHDLERADGVMIDAFERFRVWKVYVDGQWIGKLIDRWQGRWGDKKVKEWATHRAAPMAYAVKEYTTAMNLGDLSHDGDPLMERHIANARREPVNVKDDTTHRQMHILAKDRPDSPDHKDAADAGVLSWEARRDAIAAGVSANPEPLVTWGS